MLKIELKEGNYNRIIYYNNHINVYIFILYIFIIFIVLFILFSNRFFIYLLNMFRVISSEINLESIFNNQPSAVL